MILAGVFSHSLTAFLLSILALVGLSHVPSRSSRFEPYDDTEERIQRFTAQVRRRASLRHPVETVRRFFR